VAGLIAFYSIIHLTSDAEIRAALREFHRTVVDQRRAPGRRPSR